MAVRIALGDRALGDRSLRVSFAATGEDFGAEMDPLLPLTLLPAMVTGSSLRLPGKVSPKLVSSLPKIQDLLCLWGEEHWDAKFRRVPVEVKVQGELAEQQRASGVACFFSGGVDSFYTLLKHLGEVTHIIFVHGFDITLKNQSLRARASHAAREVARELGKTLIEVETNLRSFSDPLINWDRYHGAALASVGLLFQHLFGRVLIPSSFTYADLFPWGTHPLLDPLWSTELTQFEHDGCEATRIDKVTYISDNETAMKWLRVCWVNPSDAYNCGRCAKCRLTMVNLLVAGALERCKTLPDTLKAGPTGVVARMNPQDPAATAFARQNIQALGRLGGAPELARALAQAMPPGPPAPPPERRGDFLAKRVLSLGQREEPGVGLKEVLNPAQWDAAVKALGGSVTQSWGWGVFQERGGWRPLRLLEERGRGAVQLLLKDLPGGFRVAYAPYGPVASDTSDLAELVAAAARYARLHGAYLLKVDPRWGIEVNQEALGTGRYVRAEKELPGRTLIVDLPEDPEEHLRSLPKESRYGIRRSYREGVEVSTLSRGAMDMYAGMGEFVELLKVTSERHGFAIAPRSLYQHLMIDLPSYLLLAHRAGTLLAGALVVTFGKEAYYLYGASERENLYAPYLVQWEAMDLARRAGCSRYDMWGIPRPAYAEASGLYRFKKRFAGTAVEYAGASIRILSRLELWEHGAMRLGARGRDVLEGLRGRLLAGHQGS